MVTISYGANTSDLEGFEGKNVGDVRAAFTAVYKIPADAAATVNGARAGESTILTAGDEVAFVKQTAQKG